MMQSALHLADVVRICLLLVLELQILHLVGLFHIGELSCRARFSEVEDFGRAPDLSGYTAGDRFESVGCLQVLQFRDVFVERLHQRTGVLYNNAPPQPVPATRYFVLYVPYDHIHRGQLSRQDCSNSEFL